MSYQVNFNITKEQLNEALPLSVSAVPSEEIISNIRTEILAVCIKPQSELNGTIKSVQDLISRLRVLLQVLYRLIYSQECGYIHEMMERQGKVWMAGWEFSRDFEEDSLRTSENYAIQRLVLSTIKLQPEEKDYNFVEDIDETIDEYVDECERAAKHKICKELDTYREPDLTIDDLKPIDVTAD